MINLKQILIICFYLFFISEIGFANQSNNVLLNPTKNNETIIDIGYNKEAIPYSASIPKTFIETPALSKAITSYINVLKRDHEVLDCVTDDYGDTSCPGETLECLANVETTSGNSTFHTSIQIINKNKISTTRGNALYPNELKADYKLNPNIGAVDGSRFNITSTSSYSNSLPSPIDMYNAGFMKNGKFTIKAFNFGSGYGQLYFNQAPSRTTTLISGGSTVTNGKISSDDGLYAIVEMQWDVIPSSLSFGCDDFCLVGNPNDIGFGFWNVGCIAGYTINDNILSEAGTCKREYSYYTYDCEINNTSIKKEEQWVGPINAGGDCQGIGLNANLSCNASVADNNNCMKTNFVCPANSSLPCTKIASEDAIVKNLYDGYMYNFGKVEYKYKELKLDKICEGSGSYSSDTNMCVGNKEYKCANADFTYDKDMNECLGEYVCNGYFSAITGLCETAPQVTCPTGSNYNLSERKCIAEPKCDDGTLNLITLKCEKDFNCDTANGWSADLSLSKCVKGLDIIDPICPETFMAWNSSKHICEGYMDFNGFSKVAIGQDTGNWNVQSNNNEVIQTLNGTYPTLFMSNQLYSPKIIKTKFLANTVDDDSIGLAFGFKGITDTYVLNWTSLNNTVISANPIKTITSTSNSLNNGSSPGGTSTWNQSGGILPIYNINIGNYTYPFEVKEDGYYILKEQTDNFSTVMIDNVVVHRYGVTSWNGWYTPSSYSIYLKKGMHSININAANEEGPYGTAVVIYTSAGSMIWNTRTGYLKEVYTLSCEDGFTLINDMCYELNAWTKGSKSMTIQKITSINNHALDGRINYAENDLKWVANKWYDLELRFNESKVDVYVDNTYIMSANDLDLPATTRVGLLNQSQANVNYKDFYMATVPICASGYTYNPEYDLCYINSSIGTIDFTNRLLLNNGYCDIGGIYDTTINKCLYTPECFIGGGLDENIKKCTVQESNTCPTNKNLVSGITYETCSESSLCTAPYVLDKSTNSCQAPIINCSLIDAMRGICYENTTTCSNGYTYNNNTLRCEKAISCLDGGTVDSNNKSCMKEINDSCLNVHITGYDKVCESNEICATGTIKVSTPNGYMCQSTKELECEYGYIEDVKSGICIIEPTCKEGYVLKDGKCYLTYNWAEYTCDEGWDGPLIDTGADCNASCGKDGCWCNNKVSPANNCKKAFSLTNEENSYNLTEKRPVEYHTISGTGLSTDEYGEFKDYSCGENCTYDLISITGKNNELCFEKRNGENSCVTVNKCYFEGKLSIDATMENETKITNLFLEDAYTLKSNYNSSLKDLGEPVDCENGIYNSTLKKCEPFLLNLMNAVATTSSTIDYANSFVEPKTGTVTDFQNSIITNTVNTVIDYTNLEETCSSVNPIVTDSWSYSYWNCDSCGTMPIYYLQTLIRKAGGSGSIVTVSGNTGVRNDSSRSVQIGIVSTYINIAPGEVAYVGYKRIGNLTTGSMKSSGGKPFIYLKASITCTNWQYRSATKDYPAHNYCADPDSGSISTCPAGYSTGINDLGFKYCYTCENICPTGYTYNGTKCQKNINYDSYAYTCPVGYTVINPGLSGYNRSDPDINSVNDILANPANNAIAPNGNCKKDITYNYYGYTCPVGYTVSDKGFSSYSRNDSDVTIDNTNTLSQDVNNKLSPLGNCYKTVSFNMYEYKCPTGFSIVNSGYTNFTKTDTDKVNITTSLSEDVNSSTFPPNNCLATSICAENSFLGESNTCLSMICEEGFYYNEIDKICDQKIISTCKMNGNVGWKDRDNGIVAMANGSTALKYVMFGVTGTEKYETNTYWEGINIGRMAFKLSDGHWYVSSTYKDVDGNSLSREIPSFVHKIDITKYEVYNKGISCYDKGKNIIDYCATSFKLILPENKMSIIAMIDLESLNEEIDDDIVSDNTHDLEIIVNANTYTYKGTGRLSVVNFNDNATNTTKMVSDFVDRMDFWDSFEDGYLGYIEFLRNPYDQDSEDGFIVENKEIYELSAKGVQIIDYIPYLNKSIYVSNAPNCSEIASGLSATILDRSMLTTAQYKSLRIFGIDDYSCVLFSDEIDSFANINWSNRKNTYNGNFTFRCSPYVCSATGSCDIATCATEDRTNPTETVEYIGTLLPTEFLPNLSNISYCMEQKCDANLNYIDYCGYYQKCELNNGNVFELDGGCYEYYCEAGSVFDTKTKKCKKEGCPAGTKENTAGKCVLK